MDNLQNQIESLLFVSNKPLSAKALSKFLEKPEREIVNAADLLRQERKDSGVVVLQSDEGYQLASASAHSTLVKDFLNADLRENLTEATVEVMAIIAYRQPISKAEIEAIRGVNSQYSIRALLMRGLVEKIPNPHDGRSNVYRITTEFLQHMGLTSIDELPAFEELVKQIKLPETPQATETE